jgi:hypothetical protein
MMIAENRKLKRENDTLRSSYKVLALHDATSEDGAVAEIPKSSTSGQRPARIGSAVASAVSKFLSSDWLEGHGLRIDPDGSVVHEWSADLPITPAGFESALRDVLAVAEEP